MKSLAFLVLASAFALSACGGDDSGDGTTDSTAIDAPVTADARPGIDAPPGADAPPATSRVMEVTCPATVAATVVTTGGSSSSAVFSPAAVTISVNDIVKFTMPSSHSVVPDAPTTDDGLKVGFSSTKCLKFTAADTYHYRCSPHTGIKGTVTVN